MTTIAVGARGETPKSSDCAQKRNKWVWAGVVVGVAATWSLRYHLGDIVARVWCVANGGHHRLLDTSDPRRLRLKCASCKTTTPGWQVGK